MQVSHMKKSSTLCKYCRYRHCNIIITSINGHGAAGRIVSTPRMNWHIPSPTAVFLNTNINQNKLTNVPDNIPAMAPSRVIPFQ